MRKGKVERICGVKVYKEFDKKSIEERGRSRRPVVFRSMKDYDRKKEKKLSRQLAMQY